MSSLNAMLVIYRQQVRVIDNLVNPAYFLMLHIHFNTSCDLDHIPTSLLEQSYHVLLPFITNIINLAISTVVFADQFKS